jgi:hypothetical protein
VAARGNAPAPDGNPQVLAVGCRVAHPAAVSPAQGLTMTGAAAVLVCAIELLGRSPASMPPIEMVASPPLDVSPNADAFVRTDNATIHVVTSTAAFKNARCGNRRSLLKLASILVHEEWHVRNGSDERGAYDAQLLTLLRLGEPLTSPVYQSVYRAMQTVMRAQKQAEALRAQAGKDAGKDAATAPQQAERANQEVARR